MEIQNTTANSIHQQLHTNNQCIKSTVQKMHGFSLQEIRVILLPTTTNRIKIIKSNALRIRRKKTWILSAAEFCWRNHNRRFRSNRVCSRRFFLSLSFELLPPKSTRLRLEGSPLKNMVFDWFLSTKLWQIHALIYSLDKIGKSTILRWLGFWREFCPRNREMKERVVWFNRESTRKWKWWW